MENIDWSRRLATLDEIAEQNRKDGKEKIYGFLDFDGVINIWGKEIIPANDDMKSIREAEFQFADDHCIKLLSDFCIEHDIHIVISSSWRFSGVGYCYEYLRKVGMQRGIKISGTTALDLDVDRETHITDFLLERRDFTGWMIFDDLYMQHLTDHLIHTETLVGYDESKDQEARQMIAKMFSKKSEKSTGQVLAANI